MMTDGPRQDRVQCPGCGGRNDPSAHACEWCGRLFVAERRQISARWLAPIGGALALVLMTSVVVMALLGSRSASRASVQEPPPPEVLEATDEGDDVATAEPIVIVVTATPPIALAAPTASNVPSTPGVEFVRIANTGGAGAFIRREARVGAPGIVAYRDGTILRIVGPDTTADSRVWRNVEDRQGNRGWTPREYLDASPTGF